MKKLLLAFVALCCALPLCAEQQDPILQALRSEMERSKSQLRLPGEKPPYYIEYAVTDQDTFAADSSMGASRNNVRVHMRMLRVLVRVGDYKQDNTLPFSPGAVEVIPLDDNLEAMRHQIWLTTDKAYKAALQQLASKQVMLKQYQQEQKADDFSHESALTDIAPLVKLGDNQDHWVADLDAATMHARTHPAILSYNGFAQAMAVNEYFLNSEGSATRKGSVVYRVQLMGSSQAEDGMRFDRGKAYVIVAENELPSREKMLKDSDALIHTLEQLRAAPVVEEQYRGPVLFSADASTTLFASLIAPNVEAKKPRPEETGRTTGAFSSSYRSRVLPPFVNVTDDPTKRVAAGRALAGYYLVDDEAVKAQPVNVVEKGILKNFLINREPIADIPNSNGHGRSGAFQRTNSETGNLFVTSTTPATAAELKQQFMEACKAKGSDYCYRVDSMGGRLSPEMLYRVYVKDGREELVRGASFEQLDTRELRNGLTALGDDPTVSNFYEQFGYSVIAPSALFEELQIKRSPAGKQKLPDYAAPSME